MRERESDPGGPLAITAGEHMPASRIPSRAPKVGCVKDAPYFVALPAMSVNFNDALARLSAQAAQTPKPALYWPKTETRAYMFLESGFAR